jgi:DNA-binding response OmpR family regulator
VSVEELVSKAWRTGSLTKAVQLRGVIRRLRAKIELDPVHPMHLLTEVGGYRLALNLPAAGRIAETSQL